MAKKIKKKNGRKLNAARPPKGREASTRSKIVPASRGPEKQKPVPTLKLGVLARAGVKSIKVHFCGCDDDGIFSFKTAPKQMNLSEDAQRKIEGLLTKCFNVYGECEGSVLIGELDLEKGLFVGYSGSGTAKARVAELIRTLEFNGVQSLVAEVKAGVASKTSVKPTNAEKASVSRDTINWFLRRLRSYFIESDGYVANGEKAEAAIDRHAWEAMARTLKIDVTSRAVSLAGPGIAGPITAKVDMAKAQQRFRLSE